MCIFTSTQSRIPLAACSVAVAAALGGWSLGRPVPAAADTPVEGSQAIAFLSQQRQANGIPPITDVNQGFADAWCPNEDYGPTGGESVRVLSSLTTWTAGSSPWDNAPLHQFGMYDPRWTTAGDINVDGQACMGLGNPAPDPSSPAFYAWTSDTGPSAVPPTETVEVRDRSLRKS